MKRVIFLSKSKLAQNILQVVLSDVKFDCVFIDDISALKPEVLSQDCLVLVDDSCLEASFFSQWQTLHEKHPKKNLQSVFLLQEPKEQILWNIHSNDVLKKPLDADDLPKFLHKRLGGKS